MIMTWVTTTTEIRTTGSAHNDHYSLATRQQSTSWYTTTTTREKSDGMSWGLTSSSIYLFVDLPVNVPCFDGTKICPGYSHLVPKTVSADQIRARYDPGQGKCTSLKWNVTRELETLESEWKWSVIAACNQERISGLGPASIMDITTSYNLHFQISNMFYEDFSQAPLKSARKYILLHTFCSP